MVGNHTIKNNESGSDLILNVGVAQITTVTAMCGIDIVAICANLTIFIVIVKNTHLRQTLTNLFLVNLCFVDFLSSVLVLPISIFTYMEGYWKMNQAFCLANGFISTFLIFCSTTTLCVISIERFYSIKSPMHHAAHMTLCKTGLVIAAIWIYSGIFASLPLLGWNTYDYNPSKAHCSFTWGTNNYHRTFIVCVFMVYFTLPGVILFTMYCGIYRVAKRASSQVNPSVQIVASALDTSDSPTVAPCTPQQTVSQTETRASRTPLKAIKTLMLILSTYIILWGPYFISHLNGAVRDDIPNTYELNLLFEWMGYASFALNPFLYGVMNRAIRDECSRLFTRSICCKHIHRVQDAVEGPAINEDFYQFLERTSAAQNSKSQGDTIKTIRKDLRTLSETTGERF